MIDEAIKPYLEKRMTEGEYLQRMLEAWKEAQELVVSPNGKTLVVECEKNGTHSAIQLWGLTAGKMVREWEGKGPSTFQYPSFAFSSDGRTLATSSLDNTLRIRDVASGAELQRWQASCSIGPNAFSSDGKRLASVEDGTILVWDLLSIQK